MLQQRQDVLVEEYDLGQWKRWEFSQETQELIWSDDNGPRVIARVQDVGSLSSLSETWRWAWANSSVLPAMKQAVVRVKELGEQQGWTKLIEAQWAADEADAWGMTAVAVRLLDAKGAYKAPGKNTTSFLVIEEIRWFQDPTESTVN